MKKSILALLALVLLGGCSQGSTSTETKSETSQNATEKTDTTEQKTEQSGIDTETKTKEDTAMDQQEETFSSVEEFIVKEALIDGSNWVAGYAVDPANPSLYTELQALAFEENSKYQYLLNGGQSGSGSYRISDLVEDETTPDYYQFEIVFENMEIGQTRYDEVLAQATLYLTEELGGANVVGGSMLSLDFDGLNDVLTKGSGISLSAMLDSNEALFTGNAGSISEQDYVGSWSLDRGLTGTSNNTTDIIQVFGSGYTQIGAGLDINADGSLEWYIGLNSGSGTWSYNGDNIIYTGYSDINEQPEQYAFYYEMIDGAPYLRMAYQYDKYDSDLGIDVTANYSVYWMR